MNTSIDYVMSSADSWTLNWRLNHLNVSSKKKPPIWDILSPIIDRYWPKEHWSHQNISSFWKSPWAASIRWIHLLSTFYSKICQDCLTTKLSNAEVNRIFMESECKNLHAFNKLKDKFSLCSDTCFPSFDIPFQIYSNASDCGLGAVLAQSQRAI